MKRFFFSFSLFICFFFSCDVANNKQKPEQHETLILGHRATGPGVNNGFLENTIPAVKEALKYADGVEVDIQMSKSSSLWIYHDDMLSHLCPASKTLLDQYGSSCILNSPDSLIKKLRICREGVKERIYPLEDLIALLVQSKDKYVSLDVKGYFNNKCVPNNNVSKRYLKTLGSTLYNMVKENKLEERLFIETGYHHLFKNLKEKDTSIKCYLLGFNNMPKIIDKAANLDLDGISFNLIDTSLNIENNAILLSENLQLQLWPVYNKKDLIKGMQFKPFALQVSDINLVKSIQESKVQPPD